MLLRILKRQLHLQLPHDFLICAYVNERSCHHVQYYLLCKPYLYSKVRGQLAFTRMLCGASSAANVLVAAMTADFETPYAQFPGIGS